MAEACSQYNCVIDSSLIIQRFVMLTIVISEIAQYTFTQALPKWSYKRNTPFGTTVPHVPYTRILPYWSQVLVQYKYNVYELLEVIQHYMWQSVTCTVGQLIQLSLASVTDEWLKADRWFILDLEVIRDGQAPCTWASCTESIARYIHKICHLGRK